MAGRSATTVYGLAAVDCRGCIADQAVVRALGWVHGTRLEVHVAGGLLVLTQDGGPGGDGGCAVTGYGHLRIPARIRRRYGVAARDRVLLAADPAAGRLVVYPPAVLDEVLAAYHSGPAEHSGPVEADVVEAISHGRISRSALTSATPSALMRASCGTTTG